jgi:hypothetical protein
VEVQKKFKEPSRIGLIGIGFVAEEDFNGFCVAVRDGCDQGCHTTGGLDIGIRPVIQEDPQDAILVVFDRVIGDNAGMRRGRKCRVGAELQQIKDLRFVAILNGSKKWQMKIKETSFEALGLASGEEGPRRFERDIGTFSTAAVKAFGDFRVLKFRVQIMQSCLAQPKGWIGSHILCNMIFDL